MSVRSALPRVARQVRPIRTVARRNLAASPRRNNASSSQLPPNYPQVDYAGSTFHVFRSIGQFFTVVAILAGGTATIGLIAFQGVHFYVEHKLLPAPTHTDDEHGWADEVQGWTGGLNGGTDPRLGFKGRYAVRAAWICQNWGAGLSGSHAQGIFEPDSIAVKSMIGVNPNQAMTDRGYDLADEYLDLAIKEAQRLGLVFPPTLSVARPAGPPSQIIPRELQGDPTAMDLLLLKAGVQERIGTKESRSQAKELYEQVLAALHTTQDARILRLSSKIGDLCASIGDGNEAMLWWNWGLKRAGLDIPTGVQEAKAAARSWFGGKPKPETPTVIPKDLPPATLRATVSTLTSASAYLAATSHLAAAAILQTTALSLLPAPASVPHATTSTAGLNLHHTWLQQRSALLTLHLATVTHAQGKPALHLANTAVERADTVLPAISPIPAVYTGSLAAAAEVLHRDALATAAEASYTQGVLLERRSQPDLSAAVECFEKAMLLNERETGKQGGGIDYAKYSRSLVRVKTKLGLVDPVVSPESPVQAQLPAA